MHHIVYLQKSREAYEREWQQQQTKEKREERAAKVPPRNPKPRPKESTPVYIPPGKRNADRKHQGNGAFIPFFMLGEGSDKASEASFNDDQSTKCCSQKEKLTVPQPHSDEAPITNEPIEPSKKESISIPQNDEHRKSHRSHEQQRLYVPRHRRQVLVQMNVETSPGQLNMLVVHDGDDISSIVYQFAARFGMKESHADALLDLVAAERAKANPP